MGSKTGSAEAQETRLSEFLLIEEASKTKQLLIFFSKAEDQLYKKALIVRKLVPGHRYPGRKLHVIQVSNKVEGTILEPHRRAR